MSLDYLAREQRGNSSHGEPPTIIVKSDGRHNPICITYRAYISGLEFDRGSLLPHARQGQINAPFELSCSQSTQLSTQWNIRKG